MTTILVGLAADPHAIVRRAHELGLPAATARWLSAGVLDADAVSEWVGVSAVTGRVNLRAPDPQPGDEPGTWLNFGDDWHANTSDLLALSVTASSNG